MPAGTALAALVIAVALTVIFLFYALGLRIAHIIHGRNYRRLQRAWWPVFAEAAVAGHFDTAACPRRVLPTARIAILREWCRFHALVKTGEGTGFDRIAEHLRLRRVARRMAGRHSVSHRLLGLRALGFMGDVESWPTIEMAMREGNVAVSTTAAMALVNIDAAKAIGPVIEMLGRRPDWPRTQVGRILSRAGPELVTGPLCAAIEAAETDVAIRYFQFYESASLHEFDSLIATLLLRHNEPALIAAALKAVRSDLPVEIVGRLTRHRVWYVRMQAASLLGRSGRREDYRLLEPMLSDPEWWVRYRAAQAIVGLPFMGPNALRKLCERQADRFASDILHQALAEAGIA